MRISCFLSFLFYIGGLQGGSINRRLTADFTYLGTLGRNSSFQNFDPANYYASNTAAQWVSGLQDCHTSFGPTAHLVSIESETESDALITWLQESGANTGNYWTSGEYDIGNAVWKWAGNLEADMSAFLNWGPGQPVSENGRQRISLNYQNALYSDWESRDDTFTSRYICEVGSGTEITTTTTTTTTPAPEPITCDSENALIVVLDASLSTGYANFELGKKFATEIAAVFTAFEPSKFGFITYAQSVMTHFQLNDPLSTSEVISKILSAPFDGEDNRRTAEGIIQAKPQLESYSNGMPMRMIVVTSGRSDDPTATRDAADLAFKARIDITVVGVGNGVDETELLDIAHGDPSRVFTSDWDSLSTLLKSVTDRVCP